MNVMSYNADEILSIAIEIENNATLYYSDASRMVEGSSATQKLFLDLSTMEKKHAQTFTEMRRALTTRDKSVQPYDPGNEMLFYLQGMAGIHGWEGKNGPNARLTGKETLDTIFSIALRAEKDTVFFYSVLKDLVPGEDGRRNVDRIIREELQHIAILNGQYNILIGKPFAG